MRMNIAELWASLLLAHTSTFLLVGAQYVGPFPDQRQVQQQQRQQSTQVQQQQQQTDGPQQTVSELGYSDKRASTTLSEPTCEELRAMWRYSKRQSRAAENTNELPVYRDPFSYNIWDAYPSRNRPSNGYRDDYTGPARSRSSGAPIYGKLVHKAPAGRLRMPERTRAFEEVARLYGTVNRHPPNQRRKLTSFRVGGGLNTSPPQAGKFQHLKELILSERARELQEQRRAEEIAARAAVLKGMTSGAERRSGGSSFSTSRNANFLSSLQSYQQPRSSSYDFGQKAQYVGDGPDFGPYFSKSDRYGRDYMLQR